MISSPTAYLLSSCINYLAYEKLKHTQHHKTQEIEAQRENFNTSIIANATTDCRFQKEEFEESTCQIKKTSLLNEYD